MSGFMKRAAICLYSFCVAWLAAGALPLSDIATTSRPECALGGAFDGERYLIGLQLDGQSNAVQFVSAAGVPEGTPIPIPGALGMPPDIAYGSNVFFVAWAGYDGAVRGQLVTPAGALQGSSFEISPLGVSEVDLGTCRVAFGGGRFLVAWEDTRLPDGDPDPDPEEEDTDVFGQLVNPNGTLFGSNSLISGSGDGSDSNLSISFDGVNFLVVYSSEARQSIEDGEDVHARFVSPASGPLGSTFVIDENDIPSCNPTATVFADGRYVVLFHESIALMNAESWQIYARFVSTNGVVAADRILLAGSDTVAAQYPSLGWNGSHLLVALREGAPDHWEEGLPEGEEGEGMDVEEDFIDTNAVIRARWFDATLQPTSDWFNVTEPFGENEAVLGTLMLPSGTGFALGIQTFTTNWTPVNVYGAVVQEATVSSLFSSVTIWRSLEADSHALFEVDVSAPEGKTITVTVPTMPATVYDVTEDEFAPGEYEYYDPSMTTAPISELEAQYPQGDYVLRLYSDAGKTLLEETLVVSFGTGEALPFPEVSPALTQPVPAGDQLLAEPAQTYTWPAYSGTAGTATHMTLEITGTDEADEYFAEYDAAINGSASYTPPTVPLGDYDLELSFFFRQNTQTAGGTLVECANERYARYALTVTNLLYQLSVNNGSGSGAYTNGAIVAIVADAPPSGQVFDRWTGATQYVANVFAASTTVTMPPQGIALTATYLGQPESLFSSVTIWRSLEADSHALFEVDVSAPEGKTITVTVPTMPATVYDVTEDEFAPGEYEYYDPSMTTAPISELEAKYPQGDYVLRIYSDANKTTLEETLVVSFGTGEALPFPEVYPALTQPVPSGGQILAGPVQTYTWPAYSGTAGTATHMTLEITGTDEADEYFAEYDAAINGSASYTPPTVPLGDYDLELSFFFRQNTQTAGGTLVECANERYARYALTVTSLVCELSSTNGPYAGGNTITITNGTFGTVTNVLVGGVVAMISGSGDNWVTITIPALGSAGVKDIVIQTSDYGETTLTNAYMVNPAGVIGPNYLVAIGAGHSYSLGLKSDGSIVAWGDNNNGQTNVPSPNTDFVAVSAGFFHSLGLKSEGSIAAWGFNAHGQTDVPSPNTDFVSVSAGCYHSLGLKSDGSMVAWGWNTYGETNVPSPNTDFVAVEAGYLNSFGLKSDGRILAWGNNEYGQTSVPLPNTDFVAVAAGYLHTLGLKSDGRIVAWGDSGDGRTVVPSPNADFVAVAAGNYHSLGLKSDGSIAAWGYNGDGQTTVPVPNSDFVAIAAGDFHSLGLKSDGSIVAWGKNTYGQTTIPSLNADFGLPSGVQLKSGSWQGGYEVIINGTNLGNGSDITNVTLCGVSAAIVSQSSTQIVVTAGEGTPGTGDVAVYSISYGVTTKTAGFTYLKTDQTITFPAISDQLATDTVVLSATASSGLPVSFSVLSGPALLSAGTNLTFTGAGTVSIVASQAGDANWSAAPNVTNTFDVTQSAIEYQLTVNSGTGSGAYTNGAIVAIVADSAPAGQMFACWTGDTQYVAGVTLAATTLTMPDGPITVTATYTSSVVTLFSDGFEGATIAPFWVPSLQNGTITLATDRVHSGSQAVKFTGPYGGQKYIHLRHLFDTPQYGEVTVWVYDTFEYIYFSMNLRNSNYAGYGSSIGVQDWDTSAYYFNASMNSYIGGKSTVARSIGWRCFKVRNFSNQLVLSVDGQELYRGPGIEPFDIIELSVSGPSFGAGTIYFDDFHFEPEILGSCATPVFEPGTGMLFTNQTEVRISCPTPGASIYYTTSGEPPTTNSTLYTEPVVLAETTTIRAIAVAPRYLASEAGSADFTRAYQLTVNNGTGSGAYTNGAVVAIAAYEPAFGKMFDCWTGDTQYVASVTSAVTTLTMPDGLITLTATYKLIPVEPAYSDGFEASQLNPFWVPSLQNGTITPSSDRAHTGSQSAKFSAPGGGQKYLFLRHFFEQPQYGTVSVWVYDSMQYIYFGMLLNNSTLSNHWGAAIFNMDWDYGTFYYTPNMHTSDATKSSVARFTGWRKFTIRSLKDELVLDVDGQEMYRGPGVEPFDCIQLHLSGPSSGTIYFDEFSFVPEIEGRVADPVYEPASGRLFTNELVAALSCATAGASIYYTTDGSEPTEASALYEAPLVLTETTTLKARAFKASYYPSETASALFTRAYTLADAVDCRQLLFAIGGDIPWFIQSAVFLEGTNAVQSGAIADRQSSWMETSVEGPGTLSFHWKVSCEDDVLDDWDYVAVTVNGVEVARRDGVTEWEFVQVPLEAGVNTVRWVYTKDRVVSEGMDCAWVDGVTWTPAPQETQTTPVPVPHLWLDLYTLVLNGDYETAAFSDDDGDGHEAWEEFVAGTYPDDPESVLRVHIHFENGLPVVTWDPDLGETRTYVVEGRASLSEGEWEPASESHRFFRVRVDLP